MKLKGPDSLNGKAFTNLVESAAIAAWLLVSVSLLFDFNQLIVYLVEYLKLGCMSRQLETEVDRLRCKFQVPSEIKKKKVKWL